MNISNDLPLINTGRQRNTAGRSLSRRGIAALEFALVAPLFLVLVFGIVVYGIYFATWIVVTEAASEGARASLAGLSPVERQSLATNAVNQIFTAYAPLLATKNMTLSFPPTQNANLFSVAIAYDFSGLGFQSLGNVVPLPVTRPEITVTVSNGGY